MSSAHNSPRTHLGNCVILLPLFSNHISFLVILPYERVGLLLTKTLASHVCTAKQTSNFSEHERKAGKVNVNVGRRGIKPAVHIGSKKIVCNGRGRPMRMEIHDHHRASLGPKNSKHRSSAARVDNIHLPPVLCWLEDRSGNLKALCEEFAVAWADEHRQRGRGS